MKARTRPRKLASSIKVGTQIDLMHGAPEISFGELVAMAQRTCATVDPLGVLLGVSELARTHSIDPDRTGRTAVTPYHFGLAMLAVCCAAAQRIRESQASGCSEPEAAAAADVVSAACGLESDDLHAAANPDEARAAVHSTMVEMTIHQGALQKSLGESIARSRIVLGLSVHSGGHPPVREVQDLVTHHLGRSLGEVALLSFASVAGSRTQPGFSPSDVGPIKNAETKAFLRALNSFAQCRALDVSAVEATIASAKSRGRVAALAAEVFGATPYLDVGGGRLVRSPPAYLEDEAGLGLVRMCSGLALEQARSAGSGDPGNNSFRRALGPSFEAYVARLLAAHLPKLFEPEFTFGHKNSRSPDGILFAQDGRDAVVLECKVRNMQANAYFGLDEDALKADLAKVFAQSAVQAAGAISKLLRTPGTKSGIVLKPDEVAARLRRARRIHFVGVFWELPNILAMPGYPRELEGAVDNGARGDAQLADMWSTWRSSGRIGCAIAISCADLELVISLGLGPRFGKVLAGFASLPPSSEWFVRPNLMPPTFRNYLLRTADKWRLRSGNPIVRRNLRHGKLPMLDEALEEMRVELPAMFRTSSADSTDSPAAAVPSGGELLRTMPALLPHPPARPQPVGGPEGSLQHSGLPPTPAPHFNVAAKAER